jgi:hypothetical protein
MLQHRPETVLRLEDAMDCVVLFCQSLGVEQDVAIALKELESAVRYFERVEIPCKLSLLGELEEQLAETEKEFLSTYYGAEE